MFGHLQVGAGQKADLDNPCHAATPLSSGSRGRCGAVVHAGRTVATVEATKVQPQSPHARAAALLVSGCHRLHRSRRADVSIVIS
jgi:hypothetical protein